MWEQINVDDVDRLSKIAVRDGTASLIAVTFIFCMVPILYFGFKAILKQLNEIKKNAKGFISDEALKDVLEIFISDIRNQIQSFIYYKIEKNHIADNYVYTQVEMTNQIHARINEKREVLLQITTYNNINQFRSITTKNLTYHVNLIKDSFVEELSHDKINYNELKNSTNKQLELFELETINQINKLF